MKRYIRIIPEAKLFLTKYKIRKFYCSDRAVENSAVNMPDIQVLNLLLVWMGLAQDSNAAGDNGVARHFSHLHGWGYSYPETTGYILETFIKSNKFVRSSTNLDRAKKMADWLTSIQLENGGFTGSTVDRIQEYPLPVVFNTGQILIGLASAFTQFGEKYRTPMCKAASWLLSVQDSDGKWSRNKSPVAMPGLATYDTHVAFGLLEAAKSSGNQVYSESAFRNIEWAISQQSDNGWFANCCLSNPDAPLTHTLGYTMRGIWQAYEYSQTELFLNSVTKTSDAIVDILKKNGYLPGRLTKNWEPAVQWQCLTGNSQIAIVLLRMYSLTNESKYHKAALQLINSVKGTIRTSGTPELIGGVRGSEPVQGGYCSYQYPNWAAKFTADALMNLMELE